MRGVPGVPAVERARITTQVAAAVGNSPAGAPCVCAGIALHRGLVCTKGIGIPVATVVDSGPPGNRG